MISNSGEVRREVINPEVKSHQGGEDAGHGLVAEGVDGADVEVPQQPRGDGIPAAPWRPHGGQQLDVNERDLRGVLQIIPAR